MYSLNVQRSGILDVLASVHPKITKIKISTRPKFATRVTDAEALSVKVKTSTAPF